MKMIGNVSDWLSYAGGALIKVADSAGSTVYIVTSSCNENILHEHENRQHTYGFGICWLSGSNKLGYVIFTHNKSTFARPKKIKTLVFILPKDSTKQLYKGNFC